jgi:hypothetical protein
MPDMPDTSLIILVQDEDVSRSGRATATGGRGLLLPQLFSRKRNLFSILSNFSRDLGTITLAKAIENTTGH